MSQARASSPTLVYAQRNPEAIALMYPRASATLVDSAALRFLMKYGVPLEALQAQDEAALNELLKSQIPDEIEASFTEASALIERAMGRVTAAMPLLDPTLEGCPCHAAAWTTTGNAARQDHSGGQGRNDTCAEVVRVRSSPFRTVIRRSEPSGLCRSSIIRPRARRAAGGRTALDSASLVVAV